MIKFHEPYFTGNEINYLTEAINSGLIGGNGKFSHACQELIEQRYRVAKVLVTHSCTAALEISALMLGLKPEDEVIMPSYTFCSTASAFLRTGAKIIFCDIDEQTMMMDLRDVESKINSQTKVVVPVHYAGYSVDMHRLFSLIEGKNIDVIEDAAQGFEGFFDGKALGTIGRFGCVSFHETKNLHSGLGGALYVNDQQDFDKAVQIWERGTNRQQKLKGLVDKYTWVEIGSSFSMPELQAAFLFAQLGDIDNNVRERLLLKQCYERQLKPLLEKGYIRLPRGGFQCQGNGHAEIIQFFSQTICDEVRERLLKEGVEAYIGYVPLHSSPMGKKLGYKPSDLPVTEKIAPCVLRLPLHNSMCAEDVVRVCSIIDSYFGER